MGSCGFHRVECQRHEFPRSAFEGFFSFARGEPSQDARGVRIASACGGGHYRVGLCPACGPDRDRPTCRTETSMVVARVAAEGVERVEGMALISFLQPSLAVRSPSVEGATWRAMSVSQLWSAGFPMPNGYCFDSWNSIPFEHSCLVRRSWLRECMCNV